MRHYVITGLLLLLATSAYAQRPLNDEETAGLTTYCQHIYQRDHSDKPAGQAGYCKCFLNDTIDLHPQSRKIIMLTDAGKKDELDAYEKSLPADELKDRNDEIRLFNAQTPLKCGAILMMQ